MTEATLVVASSDETAIRIAVDRAGLSSLPRVINVELYIGGWGHEPWGANIEVLVEGSIGDLNVYERALADMVAKELGSKVVSACDYDREVAPFSPTNMRVFGPPESPSRT